MIHLGKALEAAARKIRPYLIPAHRRGYRNLVARGLRQRQPHQQIVCLDFANHAIDAVGGRYYFSLVRELIDAGYFPVFIARRATLSTFASSPLKAQLLDERLGVISSLDKLQEPYFLITDRAQPRPAYAEKIVVVNYEWRVCRNADEIAFPFFVHPGLALTLETTLPPEPASSRPARLFFGGNTEDRKYDKDVIREVYGMLSRREMLATAMTTIAPEKIFKPANAAEWLEPSEFHFFGLCETQHCKIPQDRWLEALTQADFFLACPGVGMPLCHNLIEAMAVGSIPILQYADYLSPPLQDQVNCLTFDDVQSLGAVLQQLFAMSDVEITTLRAHVRAYFAEHLAPGRFAQRLFSGESRRCVLLLNDYRVPR